jgi:PEP-CTERM motif
MVGRGVTPVIARIRSRGRLTLLLSTSRYDASRVLSGAFVVLIVFAPHAAGGFVPISQPDATYVSTTTLLPINAADFDVVSSLSVGGLAVNFDVGLVALTVPSTWGSWGSPPGVESSTPRVLWTNGFTSMTVTLDQPVSIFGVEAQPNTAVVSSMIASFFSGADLLGEIALDVDGNGGARLFAASSTTPFDRIVISSTDDFAIAQIRVGVPEPSTLTLLAVGSVIAVGAATRRGRAIPVPR